MSLKVFVENEETNKSLEDLLDYCRKSIENLQSKGLVYYVGTNVRCVDISLPSEIDVCLWHSFLYNGFNGSRINDLRITFYDQYTIYQNEFEIKLIEDILDRESDFAEVVWKLHENDRYFESIRGKFAEIVSRSMNPKLYSVGVGIDIDVGENKGRDWQEIVFCYTDPELRLHEDLNSLESGEIADMYEEDIRKIESAYKSDRFYDMVKGTIDLGIKMCKDRES